MNACLRLIGVPVVDLEAELGGDGPVLVLRLSQLDHLLAAEALRTIGIRMETRHELRRGLLLLPVVLLRGLLDPSKRVLRLESIVRMNLVELV